MADELKPCPFCGGEAEAYHVIDGSFACSCSSCSYASCAGFNTEQEAIAAWNTRAERTCMDVNEAWSDVGANVFSDDALDDFDKFEKVYQICQEIVEPLDFTCWIERTEQDEFGSYDYLSCGHIAMRQWPEKTRYCPNCGAKVVSDAD